MPECETPLANNTYWLQTHFADDSIELSEDANYIRRKTKHERLSIKDQGFCRARKAVELGLKLAAENKHTGLLLPAEFRFVQHICEDVHSISCSDLLRKRKTYGVRRLSRLQLNYLRNKIKKFSRLLSCISTYAVVSLPSCLQ